MKVQELIDRAGGIGALAALLKVSRTSVYDWRRKGSIPPWYIGDLRREFEVTFEEAVELVSQPRKVP